MEIIESGLGWLNVEVVMPGIDSNAYVLGPMREIVDGGKLGLYATSDAEAQFMAKIKVSTVYSPLLSPGSEGFNSGNSLIGLQCVYSRSHLFSVVMRNL